MKRLTPSTSTLPSPQSFIMLFSMPLSMPAILGSVKNAWFFANASAHAGASTSKSVSSDWTSACGRSSSLSFWKLCFASFSVCP